MSADIELDAVEPDAPASDLIQRTFEAEITPGDGRTIDVRIVPYGERATVADGHGGLKRGIPYEEEWIYGAFADQVRAKGRERHILVNFEHSQSLRDVVGHGLALREASDGLYGSFALHETADGDKALMLVREGILEGISLEAKPLARPIRDTSGVIKRVKAHLKGIALCRTPAFAGAKVLALREQDIVLDEEQLPVTADSELIERCRRLGIRLPQRYQQGHPDETDTPAQTGTSAIGTAHTGDQSQPGGTEGAQDA